MLLRSGTETNQAATDAEAEEREYARIEALRRAAAERRRLREEREEEQRVYRYREAELQRQEEREEVAAALWPSEDPGANGVRVQVRAGFGARA